MDITPSGLDWLFKSFDFSFQTGLSEKQELWYDKLAMTRPSSTFENVYPFMGLAQQMREWVGERQIQSVTSYRYNIVNKKWELTYGVERTHIEDDQYGLYQPLFTEVGRAISKWPDVLLCSLLKACESTIGYDGQNYFDQQHPVDIYDPAKGLQRNLYPGMPLTPDNYASMRSQMMSLKGENNLPLGVKPNLLVVPPQREQAARLILNADFIAPSAFAGQAMVGSNSNILKGTADLLVIPELSDRPDEWYLFDTTRSVKPFVWQVRKAPVFVPLTDPQSPNVFLQDTFYYGVDARGNVGCGLWQFAAKARP